MKFTFKLNSKPMSELASPSFRCKAFSGMGAHTNTPASMCVKSKGPIPRGTYYMLDRESGGRLGFIRDRLQGKHEWFALYANDGKIDDQTYCSKVMRGQFRLHPVGPRGISEGCITVEDEVKYKVLRALILAQPKLSISGTKLFAYGSVVVT